MDVQGLVADVDAEIARVEAWLAVLVVARDALNALTRQAPPQPPGLAARRRGRHAAMAPPAPATTAPTVPPPPAPTPREPRPADQTRTAILALLSEGPRRTGEIEVALGLSAAVVRDRMGDLQDDGLVDVSGKTNARRWRLVEKPRAPGGRRADEVGEVVWDPLSEKRGTSAFRLRD